MDPRDPKQFKELVDAVKDSYKKLEPFRSKRQRLIAAFCGSEYNGGEYAGTTYSNSEVRKVYVNLLALATNIYVRQLAARAPTARVVTPFTALRPTASDFTIACKSVAKDVQLDRLLHRVATDSLMSPMSTVKVGLKQVGVEDVYGSEVPVTETFIDLVSFDDYVQDISARSAYHPKFKGDRYYLSLDELYERYPDSKKFVKAEDELGPQDEEGTDRAESISHTPYGTDTDGIKKVALQDVYLLDERIMVTYLVGKDTKPLDIRDWDGSDEGPYFSVWYHDVPDNAMPLAPFSLIRNLHDLANSLFRRLAHQAKSKKSLVGFDNEESAKRFQKAQDGDGIHWDGQKPENIGSGGIDQQCLAMFIQVKDMFSWTAGNLDSMGGLSAQSETAKQDKMIAVAANAQIADMQEAMAAFAQKVFREVCWYEWTDPIRKRILEKPIPGTTMTIPIMWAPETRKGEFLDFNFYILPQSMQDEDPAAKIAKLNNVMMQMIIPLLPMFQEQGYQLDAKQWVELISDYSNLPELEKILVATEVPAETRGIVGDSMASGMPSQTHRTYERINRPGATRHGKDAALVQTLMGAGVQEAEGQAMTAGVS